ncbi:efflux RND transporter periplasmic adaptor subunit [Oleispirillum naphthae]|uniref:efflux RND transporter periplasmic adaptor subunit n=1 Tax=Oleispirillum naphthae TaxID=2838853 RepID=UPI003082460A
MMGKRWPWWAGVALLAALAAAGARGVRGGGRSAAAGLSFAAAERGGVEQAVSATGALKPKTYVDVGTQVSGQLKAIHVEIGDRVETGRLLAEIDPTVYRTRVAAGRARIKDYAAQVEERRAERDLAALRFRRQERLAATNVASREALDAARADLLMAEAKIDALEARQEETRATLDGDVANLGYTRILAPISGTVVDISATAGQTLNASQTAPTILRVADLDTMTVWAKVAEADVPKLCVGMPAYFTTLGDARRWHGAVRQILPTPAIESDVVLYSVLVDVSNPDGRLMSEMTAHVFFVERRAENVVVVPRGALAPTDKKGVWTVQVKTASGVEPRTVKTGLVTRTRAEVTDGLKEGEEVARAAARSARGSGM